MTEAQERASDWLAAVDPDNNGHDDRNVALEQMCRSIDGMLRTGKAPIRRVRMSLGVASVEVEWDYPQQVAPQVTVTPAPVAAVAVAAPVEPAVPEVVGHAVKSPLVGTFYSAPEPGAAPFVKVGDEVHAGQQIGIVEAMKLMNPVEADRAGVVVEIKVGNAEPVEYDQVLVVLAPSEQE
ncbi:Biotin carboxyl carrier protein of acetyl-CoA carboxylase [Alloactinosynnema sp. L-07]|uniref:acetyl-CoA carboxylase biotin carboxyl carrier protein n=1 Tax=Alloactinosynnema sp. L-07 TaxID=1653480 RepID=UPI00065EF17F|nr:acetyl-CoA carboxylase biotin carboxyl carrier protein [Alloactinosynnema sp. L-07]CRK55101.1 Biotin carboxyl carrier protein of acetyl-CoA carboxylase [Alloactinosynnema sp. L-07]